MKFFPKKKLETFFVQEKISQKFPCLNKNWIWKKNTLLSNSIGGINNKKNSVYEFSHFRLHNVSRVSGKSHNH